MSRDRGGISVGSLSGTPSAGHWLDTYGFWGATSQGDIDSGCEASEDALANAPWLKHHQRSVVAFCGPYSKLIMSMIAM